MRRILLFIIVIGISGQYAGAQGYDSFINDFNIYKNRYIELAEAVTEVEDFESGLDYIHGNIDNLKTNIESYMKSNGLYTNSKYKDLLSEVEDYYSFTSTRPNCKCLYYIDKFYDEMGASLVIVKKEKDVRVVEATVGNFKFYFAYGLKFLYYSVAIDYNVYNGYPSGMPSSGSRLSYKLLGAIKTVTVIKKGQTIKIKSLSVEVLPTPSGFEFLKCNGDFPRL